MEQQPKQINQEHIINSLANRIANLSIENAQKDAVIIELNRKIKDLEEDNEKLRESIGKKEKDTK